MDLSYFTRKFVINKNIFLVAWNQLTRQNISCPEIQKYRKEWWISNLIKVIQPNIWQNCCGRLSDDRNEFLQNWNVWWSMMGSCTKKYHSTKHQRKTCQINTDRTWHYTNILMLGETIYRNRVLNWLFTIDKAGSCCFEVCKISSEMCIKWKNGSSYLLSFEM